MMALHWYPDFRRACRAPSARSLLCRARGARRNRPRQARAGRRLPPVGAVADPTPVWQAANNIPPLIWWNNLGRIMLAVDNLRLPRSPLLMTRGRGAPSSPAPSHSVQLALCCAAARGSPCQRQWGDAYNRCIADGSAVSAAAIVQAGARCLLRAPRSPTDGGPAATGQNAKGGFRMISTRTMRAYMPVAAALALGLAYRISTGGRNPADRDDRVRRADDDRRARQRLRGRALSRLSRSSRGWCCGT